MKNGEKNGLGNYKVKENMLQFYKTFSFVIFIVIFKLNLK